MSHARTPSEVRRVGMRRIAQPLQEFMETEAAGGIALIVATVVALGWANSPWSGSYEDLLHAHVVADLGFYVVDESVHFWVNDVLMVLFFFLVGMEIKRELVVGELNSVSRAIVPLAGALGGMLIPISIFLLIVGTSEGNNGWGIPMATDIAFALGVAALLGPRVPVGLKVLLLAIAIFDDLGAVAVIAVAYSDSIEVGPLALGLLLLGGVFLMNRLGVREIPVYILAGVVVWAAILKSGVHPTTVGVALGLLTPLRSRYPLDAMHAEATELLRSIEEEHATGEREAGQHHQSEALLRLRRMAEDAVAPLERLEHGLNPWVAFLIVPIFALANAGVNVGGDTLATAFGDSLTWGIAAGLFLGKPIGILLGCWVAVRLGARLPVGATWYGVLGVAAIAGIGFTVALFVAGLANTEASMLTFSKVGILAGSLMSGIVGYLLLRSLPIPAGERLVAARSQPGE